MEYSIECSRHASLFDYRSGEVESPPAREDLGTYPTKIENGRVLVEL